MLTALIKRFISDALEEDLGPFGDMTSLAVIPQDARGQAVFIGREPFLFYGWEIVREVFVQTDPELHLHIRIPDGKWVDEKIVLAIAEGPIRSLLAAERTSLNFIQHLSAIATRTHKWVERLAPYETRLMDTRKTIPGWRALQKEAVRAGGGLNHRFGLFDGVLIKDNHIAACGSIAEAVKRAHDHFPYRKIEIEVADADMARQALGAGADILLLDNMAPKVCAEVVALARGEAMTEASGGIGEDNLEAYAETGVDFISTGALTHSVQAVDIAMKI